MYMFYRYIEAILQTLTRLGTRHKDYEEMMAHQHGRGYIGSKDNFTALRGVRTLADLDALYDGSLRGKKFDKANLANAPFEGAYLVDVSLREAILTGADFSEAILHGTNLRGADLTDAIFTLDTMLPDGSMWTPHSDLSHFTNPQHADFFDLDDEDDVPVEGSAEAPPPSPAADAPSGEALAAEPDIPAEA